MSSTFSNLKFELIANGEQSGTWGTTTNTNIGTAIEQAVVGMATLSSGDFTANVATLTLTNTNAAQNARALVLNIASGAVSAAGTINVPAIQKPYIIINGSSFTVTVKVSGLTGVAVPAGKRTVVYNNGTDVGSQIDWLASLDAATATLSGNLTLSGGTANGVAYLNGSKVLTTGSALTFDGTNLNVGSTAVTAVSSGAVTSGVLAARAALASHQTGASVLQYTGSVGSIRVYGETGVSGALAFSLGTGGSSDSEQMRLTSTGLGIGTSSPGSYSSRLVSVSQAGGAAQSLDAPSGTNTALNWYYNGTAKWTTQVLTTGEFRFFDFTAAATRLTIDTSGNLGLGVTPSAWSSSWTALQVKGAALWTDGNTRSFLTTNLYFDGSNRRYISTNPAFQYTQDVNGHQWYTAPSGTAGNAISFTQAMTLTAAGDFLVGQTVVGETNSNGFWTYPTGGKFGQNHVNGTSSGAAYAQWAYNGTIIGSITQNGTTGVLYNITSDQRLKENIQDSASASALIDSLQVRQYDWKSDGSHQRYGFIAQELVSVAPEAVHQPADPEEMMAVDYSKLVPMLVKEIQSLRARVAALESN